LQKRKMQGFIFTIDAIAAIAIVIVLAVTWSIAVRAKTGEKYFFTYTDKVSRDESLVAIYSRNLHSDEFEPLDVNMNISCKKYFTIKENDKHDDKGINVYTFCKADTLVLP